MCPTSTAWSACPTRRTGCITTRRNASTNCLSTSSPPRHRGGHPEPHLPTMEVVMSTTAQTGTDIRPFHVDTPEEKLAELSRRISATRWPSRELVTDRSQGVQLATIQELATYWVAAY